MTADQLGLIIYLSFGVLASIIYIAEKVLCSKVLTVESLFYSLIFPLFSVIGLFVLIAVLAEKYGSVVIFNSRK